jgi:hypothetical protein
MKINVNEIGQIYLTPESEKQQRLVRDLLMSITTKGVHCYWGDVEFPDGDEDDCEEGYKIRIAPQLTK